MSRIFSIKQRIVRQLERLAPMRLQPERVPNAADGHVTQADGFRHVPRTPVRRAARRRFQRANDHLLDLLVGDRPLRARPRLVVQPVQALPDEPPAPLADRPWRDVQSPRDHLAVGPVGTRQDDARPPRHVRAPIASDAPASPVVAVRPPSKSTQPWGVPFACSPPCRAVRAGRAICFSFYGYRTLEEPGLELESQRNMPRSVPQDDAVSSYKGKDADS